jgi:hypothetical protein
MASALHDINKKSNENLKYMNADDNSIKITHQLHKNTLNNSKTKQLEHGV